MVTISYILSYFDKLLRNMPTVTKLPGYQLHLYFTMYIITYTNNGYQNGYYYILTNIKKYACGYQVTRLPVTFVMHNLYATIKIMVSYLTVTKYIIYCKLF